MVHLLATAFSVPKGKTGCSYPLISYPHISKRDLIIIAAVIIIMIIIGRSLLGKEELAQEGCMIFSAILKYMGDLPSRSSFTLDIQSRLYHLVYENLKT